MMRKLKLQFLLVLACLLISTKVLSQSLLLTVTDSDGQPVPNAVIELSYSGPDSDSEPEHKRVDQVDKEFVPTVTTLMAGGRVSFPNSDDILHHVYSFSPTKTFNIPLYGRGDNDGYFETFPQTGVVEIGCNIHDWMLAFIYVGDSPHMAITDERGRARLEGLPAGSQEVVIWHSRLSSGDNRLREAVELTADSEAVLDLTLELERDRRIRRAPSSTRDRYR